MKNDFKPAVDHRFKLSGDWGSVDCQAWKSNRTRPWPIPGAPLVSAASSHGRSHRPGVGPTCACGAGGFPGAIRCRPSHGAKAGWPRFFANLEQGLRAGRLISPTSVTNGEKTNENQGNQRSTVDDQEKALRFYTDVLGLPEEGRFQHVALSLVDGCAAGRAGRNRSCNLRAHRRPGGQGPSSKPVSSSASPPSCSSPRTWQGRLRTHQKRRGAEFAMPPTEVTGLDHRPAERLPSRQPHPNHSAGALVGRVESGARRAALIE